MTFNERYVALTVPILAEAKRLGMSYPESYAVGALATLLLLEQDQHEITKAKLEALSTQPQAANDRNQ